MPPPDPRESRPGDKTGAAFTPDPSAWLKLGRSLPAGDDETARRARRPDYGLALFPQHAEMLEASGVPPDHARSRGYRSVDQKTRLEQIKVTRAGRNNIPGLLVPQLRPDGSTWGYQYRPDSPRLRDGKPVKYETPTGQRNGIDVPPGVGPQLDDPSIPLWVTEGVKKADAAAVNGLCCVALPGVWSWVGKGGVVVPDWRDIVLDGRRVVLAFDSDVTRKRAVRSALDALAGYLSTRGAKVEYLHLPDDDAAKCGLDDYLTAGNVVADLWRLVRPDPPAVADVQPATTVDGSPPPGPVAGTTTPVILSSALDTFGRWLHLDDTAPMLAVAATVVANRAEGDPVWLLLVGPPSGGKTEILQACSPLPYVLGAATISPAALLSGTSRKERAADATGGLLRQIGDFGILLAKDFTSVLSQNKDTAKEAMAALREVYDGSWDRPVGTDGGRVLSWSGKCGLVGGVTPSYDRYATIVNTLGDRFLLLRLPDVLAHEQAMSALVNFEHEKQMRAELAAAMTGLIAGADLSRVHEPLHDDERDALIRLAIFAVRARTGVERDGYSGELLVLPQVEGPARLVKAIRRLYGALGAIGADDETRWSVVVRVALDCAPAIRVPLMRALLAADAPPRTSELAQTTGMVTKTASRQLDDLTLLGIAQRSKLSDAANSPDLWEATGWLREYWPSMPKVRQRTTTGREEEVKEALASHRFSVPTSTPLRSSLSHYPGRCPTCGYHVDTQGHAADCNGDAA
ncbi:MAG: DUF3854 domain-containing protein [Nocardioidaceae bacterium]